MLATRGRTRRAVRFHALGHLQPSYARMSVAPLISRVHGVGDEDAGRNPKGMKADGNGWEAESPAIRFSAVRRHSPALIKVFRFWRLRRNALFVRVRRFASDCRACQCNDTRNVITRRDVLGTTAANIHSDHFLAGT